jgi:hypothetical protein
VEPGEVVGEPDDPARIRRTIAKRNIGQPKPTAASIVRHLAYTFRAMTTRHRDWSDPVR